MDAFTEHRGPAEYFHGRTEIIKHFVHALEHYRNRGKGTTFLIKGPPGVGKTALLTKLAEHADDIGYAVKDTVSPSDLYVPEDMAATLGVEYTSRKELGAHVDAKIVGVSGKKELTQSSAVVHIVQKAALGNGLLLVLDEAQHLAELVTPEAVKVATMNTLDKIHNGKVGLPVFLLAGGLGTTELAFESLGVSRFEDTHRVRLGALGHTSTCAVIHDHLCHCCGMKNPPTEWIESLAEQSQGWPHHMMSCIESFKGALAQAGGDPTKVHLKQILVKGEARMSAYYQARAHGISRKQRVLLASLFTDLHPGESVDREDVIEVLETEYPSEVAQDVFTRALRQGVLDEREDGDFAVPIPSMHTWLVRRYAKERQPQKLAKKFV